MTTRAKMIPKGKAICFYHTDLDGICSAAIVKYVCPEIELRPINYGHEFPWNDIQDVTVVMVDFSLQPFGDMIRLAKEAKSLTWIDHHKTALEAERTVPQRLTGLRRIGEAGCELTWEYFMTGERPWAVTALGRWDVWDHSDPRYNWFQFGMRAINPQPDDQLWKNLFLEELHNTNITQNIVESGKMIVQYTEQAFEEMVHAYGFVTEWEGYKWIMINAAFRGGSKMFASVWDETKYDAMLVYRYSPKAGMYTCSMYTDKAGVDVGSIAKKHGGGGHTGAAGFQFEEPPFPITNRPVSYES